MIIMKEFPSGFGIVIQLNLDVFSTPVILNITRMQFGLGFFKRYYHLLSSEY